MKLKEFAQELKTPESTIRTWRRRGDLPAYVFLEIGGTVFVDIVQFQEFKRQATA